MPNENSFTIPQLIKALKKAGFPTKKDVEDIIFNKITEFHYEMIAPEFKKIQRQFKNTDKRFSSIDKHFY